MGLVLHIKVLIKGGRPPGQSSAGCLLGLVVTLLGEHVFPNLLLAGVTTEEVAFVYRKKKNSLGRVQLWTSPFRFDLPSYCMIDMSKYSLNEFDVIGPTFGN